MVNTGLGAKGGGTGVDASLFTGFPVTEVGSLYRDAPSLAGGEGSHGGSLFIFNCPQMRRMDHVCVSLFNEMTLQLVQSEAGTAVR